MPLRERDVVRVRRLEKRRFPFTVTQGLLGGATLQQGVQSFFIGAYIRYGKSECGAGIAVNVESGPSQERGIGKSLHECREVGEKLLGVGPRPTRAEVVSPAKMCKPGGRGVRALSASPPAPDSEPTGEP
jgi:hypothetical protein